MILTYEDLCEKMGEDMEEIKVKKGIALEIRKLLDEIPRKHLDILHYIVKPNDIPYYDYKMTDMYALKEYLLYISMYDENFECREDFNKNLDEELWLRHSKKQLDFIQLALLMLKTFHKIADTTIRDIRRGLRTYPFPEA